MDLVAYTRLLSWTIHLLRGGGERGMYSCSRGLRRGMNCVLHISPIRRVDEDIEKRAKQRCLFG